MLVNWFCRSEKYSTSLKMIWWRRIYLFWIVTHVSLYGLDNVWTQKYDHKLWTLERYMIHSYFLCIECYKWEAFFFQNLKWIVKPCFVAEISRTWHSNGECITRNTTLCHHWRKWTPIFHQVLQLGFSKISSKDSLLDYIGFGVCANITC